ncbi:uncharacterized protein LOC105799065 isoform X2 [Gossypium raimondii]|nr:uncharacterized protein LOC105799065 isoform X2 [Gossypium raimondii]
MQKSNDKVIEVTNAIVNSKALEDDIEDEAMKEKPELSAIKHSLSIQNKGGSTLSGEVFEVSSVGQSTGPPITEGIVPVLEFCPQSPQRTVSGSQKGMPQLVVPTKLGRSVPPTETSTSMNHTRLSAKVGDKNPTQEQHLQLLEIQSTAQETTLSKLLPKKSTHPQHSFLFSCCSAWFNFLSCMMLISTVFLCLICRGSTKEKIEKETGVQIILPSSKQNDSIIIEGTSADSVAKASEEIQRVIDEAVKTTSFDYSHFVSLPLAIHPELVSKLVGFQNSILGSSDACIDENPDGNSDGDNSEDSAQEQQLGNISVELEVADDEESVKVDVSVRPLDSNAPKENEEPKSSNKSDLKIGKSVFIKPQTFHLTVLMLKLWNQKRVDLAAQVLKSTSSRVLDALDNRPVFVRLKGLDLMRGSLAKAQVVYAPAEEIDSENRLLHACKIMIDAFVEAGLVIDKDAKSELKLHATVMNARHRKRGKKGRFSSFNARAIFEHFGSEEWGEYLIREAHLSQRFKYDENGYYHCCASIPFPENISS